MNYTIRVAKTKALISFAVTAKLICVFVFAYTKNRFSHNEAQFSKNSKTGWPIKAKFHVKHPSEGNKSCINGPDHMTKMTATLMYYIRTFKHILPQNQKSYLAACIYCDTPCAFRIIILLNGKVKWSHKHEYGENCSKVIELDELTSNDQVDCMLMFVLKFGSQLAVCPSPVVMYMYSI